MSEYESIFETLNLDEATLAMSHDATIVPRAPPRQALSDAADLLPEITTVFDRGIEGEYEVLETLGVGGMGIVSLAEQKALRRMVAIKEPKGDDAWTHGRVLEEALVMGRMEHPNVVPAYGLGRRPNGQPVLVMKRVEGVSWKDVLAGRASAPGEDHVDLVWHLRVLLQVCNALRFAHSRRVVHRDIKPENVMIGEFGEVYLLDWGIALSLVEESVEGFPTRETSQGFAGTPVFMAPEMTLPHAREVDERTDICLLGATLHMILTDEPPHQGETLEDVCGAAFVSAPRVYGEHVPQGLAAIALRAMARERADRHGSVGEFAAAVEGYLEHRASYTLSAAAAAMLRLARGAGEAEDTTAFLMEAEFGFRQALNIWSENEGARAGLRGAIESRARASIARGEVVAARAALAQLSSPSPELAASVAALEGELAARAERVSYLERFERELDMRAGMRSRQRAVVVFGVAFTTLCLTQSWSLYQGAPEVGTDGLLSVFWRILLIAGVITAVFHRQLFRNVANRRLIALLWSSLIFLFVLRFGASHLGVSVQFEQLAETCVLGMNAAAIGINTSRRLVAVSLGYGVAAMIGAYFGQMWIALLALGIQHILFFSTMAWLWRPVGAPTPPPETVARVP